MTDEKSAKDAPCQYQLSEAEAWASGYNSAASEHSRSDGMTFDFHAEYWKWVFPNPYTPVKYSKHTAVNAATLRAAMEIAREKAPELGDIIAALLFFNCTNAEREELRVKGETELREKAEADLARVSPPKWRLDTNDDVEKVTVECGWSNRSYMTESDYRIWCDRMRRFAILAFSAAVLSPAEASDTVLIDALETAAWNGGRKKALGYPADMQAAVETEIRKAREALSERIAKLSLRQPKEAAPAA